MKIILTYLQFRLRIGLLMNMNMESMDLQKFISTMKVQM